MFDRPIAWLSPVFFGVPGRLAAQVAKGVAVEIEGSTETLHTPCAAVLLSLAGGAAAEGEGGGTVSALGIRGGEIRGGDSVPKRI